MKSRLENNKIKPDVFTSLSFINLLVLGIITIILNRIAGEEAIGYGAGSILMFIFASSVYLICFERAVCRMVRLRAKRNQYRNASKNMKFFSIIAMISGLLLSIVFILVSGPFIKIITGSSMGQMIFLCAAPSFFFMSIIGVIRGYMYGFGYTYPYFISSLIQIFTSVILGFLFAFLTHGYGVKIGNLIHVEETASVYSAAGVMAGLSVGTFVSMIYILIAFYLRRHEMKHIIEGGEMIIIDNGNETFPILGPLLIFYALPVLIFIIDEVVYTNHKAGSTDAIEAYGIFYGRFLVVLIIFASICILPFVKKWYQINVRIDKLDLGYAGNRFCGLMVYESLIAVPFSTFSMFMAGTVTTCIFGKENDAATGFWVIGMPLIGFICLWAILTWILVKQGRESILITASLVSFVAHIISLILFMGVMGKGLHAIIVALYVQLIIYDAICFIALYQILKLKNTFLYIVIGKIIVCSLLTSVVVMLLDKLLVNIIGEPLTLILSIIVFVFVYYNLLLISGTIGRRDLERMPLGNIFAIYAGAIGLLKGDKR
ncbi:MAG: hypothetical protein K6B41_13770 [Butyrivibrio sp.]|nr:hypothetical protein [Butyrivibrio sp.]